MHSNTCSYSEKGKIEKKRREKSGEKGQKSRGGKDGSF